MPPKWLNLVSFRHVVRFRHMSVHIYSRLDSCALTNEGQVAWTKLKRDSTSVAAVTRTISKLCDRAS